MTAVTELRGVGPRLAERLAKLGIHRVEDLLFHLPLRYQDRTRVVPLGTLQPGMEALVEGEIDHVEVVVRRRRALLVHVSDGTGRLLLRFFHFSRAQQEGLARKGRIRCFGEARRGPACLEIVHPEYSLLDRQAAMTRVEESLHPIYPTTEGISQKVWFNLTTQALERLDTLPDLLPEALAAAHGLPTLHDALRLVHRPPPDIPPSALIEGRHPAQRRLAFEELLAHHLSLARLRRQKRAIAAPPLAGSPELEQGFLETLPFALTGAQQRVCEEIRADLARPRPMLRLVQGDVGSGKTVVAALAALRAVGSGFQAAVMAPTEILAEQHFLKFDEWFSPLGLRVAWLSGSQKAAQRREQMALLADGQAHIAVGTHALFQDEVAFRNLALVIIDEQHRFGVHQRMALRDKGAGADRQPHQLIMTATPIPRTLAMTAYADLDLSVIDELPPGRTPVRTVAIPDSRRAEVVERVARACAEGRQAYWVCTLIEDSEALQCEAAEATWASLTEALPGVRVGLVHGRMKAAEKEAVMQSFKKGDLDLLVATTVIEVGVDVPNASLMVIENAERLGLSQLHQLRGRVGRGSVESACVLMYHPPLSDTARQRLDALRRTTDGFEIARIDLELRGPGEVLGTRQTGSLQFRIADLERDADLVPDIHRAARHLAEADPDCAQALIDRWLGEAEAYGQVG
ncbi:MAG: ATP-dependent DNA helicase RecG [Gammaproteobacteria bacterium]|nr:MAG: ATP-dependent DNA helicase RecG [Gammaproteobacteria bacterium]